ncbi:hypothetical protein CYMTET_3105 [Cymbomonas tetramitiformis]|uniref:Uncharacterized protein n=1 Tax=Cymbomonas tetramitiformis TaxID=36881 RepID=A0AAE0H3U2_9CHLO|nr:hypothetical protein CYMTET_3105 [Cymbomonas tetramitiformis]
MLAGDDQATSPAYEWWCAAYEKDGMMASTVFRVLKDVSVRDSFQEFGAKFLMKGTKEKADLLVAKPQTPEHDDLAYVIKLCMRREAALNAGKMVEDSTTRQNIEDCIKLLRIKEYKERVSEQLRVQFPAPNKLGKVGIDLPEMVAAMRRSGAAKKVEAGDRRKDFKKKEPTARAGDESPKKPAREAHNAERAKHSYNKVPPPDAKKDKQCRYCFTQIPHSPDRCYTGSTDAYVPQDFHKKRRAQALSEDELEYQSNFNEREEYAPEDRIGSVGRCTYCHQIYEVPTAKQSCSQLAATLVIQGLIHLPKDIDAFLALEEIEGRGFSELVDRAPAEINKHQVHDSPETVLSKAGMVSTRYEGQTDDQELPLDEMPDRWGGRPRSSQVGGRCLRTVNDCGVVDFSEHGHVRVGTIQNQAYEALRLKMKDHLTEDQALQMAQNNSWDLLVGTGPLKNSLMIDIKLGRGVTVSYAPSVLGMDTQVILPLVNLTPPKNPRCVRKMDPMVCLTTKIFGPELVCGCLEPRSSQNEEQRVAASAERPEHFEDLLAPQSPLPQEERARLLCARA